MTVQDYENLLWSLFPVGLAWDRERIGVLGRLICSFAVELAQVDNRVSALFKEADPKTTSGMLSDWERAVGLPDECSALGSTLDERRESIVVKLASLFAPTPARYREIATLIGYDVDIEEWKPFTCGLASVGPGYHLGDEGVRHVWQMDIYGQKILWFKCGVSECGDALGVWRDAVKVICHISKTKPAHTKVIYGYKEARI